MAHTIFISHSGVDTASARAVADRLIQNDQEARLDREELRTGDSFLRFMEDALQKSDYCLLLWSEAASKSPWVRVEWEAAFYRTIQESRRFLVVGRLEDLDPPKLIAPRLRIELFPEMNPGLDEFLQMIGEDDEAADISGKPVGQAALPVQEDEGGETVYLTSELFGLTMPILLDFDVPCGIHLDRIRKDLDLPDQLDLKGKLGMRMEYRLAIGERSLERSKSLSAQGVAPKDVIWLEVEMKPFSASSPVSGGLESAIFRSIDLPDDLSEEQGGGLTSEHRREGRRLLLRAISKAGLGF